MEFTQIKSTRLSNSKSRRRGRLFRLSFDKSGNTNFWNKDFVNALPIRDDDYLTKRFGELLRKLRKTRDKETNGYKKRYSCKQCIELFGRK